MSEHQVSFVIATRNRRDVLLATLAQLGRLDVGEVFVVDNASDDGTANAVRARFANVHLIESRSNAGAVARNLALDRVATPFTVFLDDDSYPSPGSVERMIAHFAANPEVGAAVFRVALPGGHEECSAYPNVFIGCGTGFRTDVLRKLGGLPADFFMQAEEYDLSLRLLDAGLDVRRFDDLLVHHLKTPQARVGARTMRLDVRNNLRVVARHFPRENRWRHAMDWTRRYWWIARANDQRRAFARGLIEGIWSLLTDRSVPVSEEAFDRFARVSQIDGLMRSLAERRLRRVLLLDAGKALTQFVWSAKRAGLEIVAIADDRLSRPGRRFRGVRIVTCDEARAMSYDVAVVANLSPVHARARQASWEGAINLLDESAER